MANTHAYTVSLNVSSSTQTKQAVSMLQDAGENLNKMYLDLASQIEDSTALEREYNKIIQNRVSEKDKEINKLIAEQRIIRNNAELSEDERKSKLDALNTDIKKIDYQKAYIKAVANETKLKVKLAKDRKTAGKENKEALKTIKNENVELEKQNKLLQKIKNSFEGIKTVAGNVKKIAGTAIKGGAGILAAGAGALSAIGSTVSGQVEKERALKSLKGGVDESVADAIYIKTGADYSTIVNAINSLSDRYKDVDELTQMATLEIQNPGLSNLIAASANMNVSASNLAGVLGQIKAQTGLMDISQAVQASSLNRSVTRGRISQSDYLLAYGALQGAGLDDERINRIINAVARKEGDFIENFNNTDISKYVRGQLRNKVINSDLALTRLERTGAPEKTAAEESAERMRELSIKKDALLIKMIPIFERVIETLDDLVSKNEKFLSDIIEGLLVLFNKTMPAVLTILSYIQKVLGWLADKFDLGEKATGGLVSAPSICGEAGPELVLPLNNKGRSQNIIYNTAQTFNIAGNQNSGLGLSQVVSNNRFIRRTSTI